MQEASGYRRTTCDKAAVLKILPVRSLLGLTVTLFRDCQMERQCTPHLEPSLVPAFRVLQDHSSADYFRMQDQRAHHGDTLLNSARALCFEYNEGCMVLSARHLATHDEAGKKRHAELKALLILTFLA